MIVQCVCVCDRAYRRVYGARSQVIQNRHPRETPGTDVQCVIWRNWHMLHVCKRIQCGGGGHATEPPLYLILTATKQFDKPFLRFSTMSLRLWALYIYSLGLFRIQLVKLLRNREILNSISLTKFCFEPVSLASVLMISMNTY